MVGSQDVEHGWESNEEFRDDLFQERRDVTVISDSDNEHESPNICDNEDKYEPPNSSSTKGKKQVSSDNQISYLESH